MSKYTTELRYLRETGYDLGLKDYPIFDENYREVLNKKILDYYNFREIGFETAGLFVYKLNQKMMLIMGKYNIMYEAQKLLLENLYGNVNLKETMDRDVGGQSNGDSTSKSNNIAQNNTTHIHQDTPQNFQNIDNIDNINYASDTDYNKSNATSSINDETESNATFTNTEDYVKMIVGNNGKKYNIDVFITIVKNIINIDEQIINELNDLFMQLW